MDVESLAKQLILQNMTPEQQLAVLDGIKASVAQAKEVQKRKIGENVDVVVQALKKIESDIRERYDAVGNAIEKRVLAIKDGRDGIDGKDGRDGKDGKPGKNGAVGPRGADGKDGRDGVNGSDGVSVTDARIDFDGSLIICLSSGREINVGEVVAPDLAERIKVITNGGGTSQSVLDTLTDLQNQIDSLIPSQTGNSGKYLTTNGTSLSWASIAGGGLNYKGTWNASTNTPTITSSVGTSGDYYVVSVSGSTNIDGITDWVVGDWIIYNGTFWQKIDQTNLVSSVNGQTGAVSLTYTDVNAIGSITSTDGSVSISTASGVADLSVSVAASTTNVICQVRNATGATLTKGTVVYISGATGQIPTVSKALANSDATSAQTLGLINADLANNSNGYVTIIGLVTDIDTSAFTDGQQLYLSGTTAGTLTATKPSSPTHLVYVAVVEYAHAIHGKLFVKVQNGYELDELHDVSIGTKSNGQTLIYNASTSLWENNTLTAGTGVSVTNGAGSITIANTAPDQTVSLTGAGTTSVTGTYPNFTITSNDAYSGTVTSVSGTGTVNGLTLTGTVTSSGSLTLGGTLSNVSLSTQVTGTLPIANGGTGQTTANDAFNALAPSQTSNSGKYLTTDGTNTSWSSITSGASLSNDTSTSSNLYPMFASATSGTPTTVYTSNSKLLYKPSTGEFKASIPIAGQGVFVNADSVSDNITIATGTNGFSVGPLTVASGGSITVSSGQRHVVI